MAAGRGHRDPGEGDHLSQKQPEPHHGRIHGAAFRKGVTAPAAGAWFCCPPKAANSFARRHAPCFRVMITRGLSAVVASRAARRCCGVHVRRMQADPIYIAPALADVSSMPQRRCTTLAKCAAAVVHIDSSSSRCDSQSSRYLLCVWAWSCWLAPPRACLRLVGGHGLGVSPESCIMRVVSDTAGG